MLKTRILTIASAASILAVAPAVAQSGTGTTAFVGHWRVAGVAVSSHGVQALADNDPSLMGKRLTFSTALLAWDQPPSTHDTCLDPQFTRLGTPVPTELRSQLRKLGLPRPTPFAIHCRSGYWGPAEHVIFRGAGGALALPWYDGGVLKLVRQ